MTPLHSIILGSATTTLVKSAIIPVVTAALTAAAALMLTRASAASDRRRDRYAAAVSTLVAWIEFPYRVRRRTNDTSETLAALANRGHDLQEQLACHQAWMATENAAVATAYMAARTRINPLVGAALHEAWESPPASTPASMNLGDWGPAKTTAEAVTGAQAAAAKRFGWKRFTSALYVLGRRRH